MEEETEALQEEENREKPVEEQKEPERVPVEISILDTELEALQAELAEAKDKYLRLLAESENARKRMLKERQEYAGYAVKNLLVEVLNPLDTFANALGFTDQMPEDVKNWAAGFQMILTQFKDILSSQGVVSYESKGKLFDPHLHEAVESVENEEVEEGTVLREYVKGYKMGERIIRPARVQVAKKAQVKEKITEEMENVTEEEI